MNDVSKDEFCSLPPLDGEDVTEGLCGVTLVEYADGKFNPDKQEQGEHCTDTDDFAA